MSFSLKTREESIKFLKDHTVDVLIIGGGITGAGVAVQAAASGMSTALVEMQDFSEGTSSRSTKLVHGGIRYLKSFDVEVVADTVRERANVQKVAPHIPKPDPMLLPIYNDPNSTFSMFSLKIAMDLYDQLANVKGTDYENRVLTKEEVLEISPHLNADGLLGGGIYLDFRNNDSRLVIENIKQAQADGGHMLSRTKVIGFVYDDSDQINGVKVKDMITSEEYVIHAKVVINTTGPWSDTVRHMTKDKEVIDQMRPTKGVHLVVDREKLNVSQPTYFDTGLNDGRMVFVVPREDKTYFGTTDTDYGGDFSHPTVTSEDVSYLLKVVNNKFPERNLTIDDIEASWAGLRPLISGNGGSDYNGAASGSITDESLEKVIQSVDEYEIGTLTREGLEKSIHSVKTQAGDGTKSPSSVSRGSSLTRADDGLITLAGGKITDYRLMAEGALNMINSILSKEYGDDFVLIDSINYPVSGGHFDATNVEGAMKDYIELGVSKGLSEKEATYLAHLYGSNTKDVLSYEDVEFNGLTKAQSMALMYSLENEMTLTPVDYALRRTNYLLFMRDQLDTVKVALVEAMKEYYQWDDNQTQLYTTELTEKMSESSLDKLKTEG